MDNSTNEALREVSLALDYASMEVAQEIAWRLSVLLDRAKAQQGRVTGA